MSVGETVFLFLRASLLAQRLKCLPAVWETWVQSLGQEDPLEKEMATHSSILAWRTPWMEELGGLQSTGRKESDTTERLHFHFLCQMRMVGLRLVSFALKKESSWRRKWQPTPVFLPRESQVQRSLVGCRLWGRTESDTTDAT